MQRLLEGPAVQSPTTCKNCIKLERDLAEVRAELEKARTNLTIAVRSFGALRHQLEPLHQALKGIFGELEAVGVESKTSSATDSPQPLDTAKWEPWKKKFGGKCAEMIDALLLYENGLNRSQWASLTGQDRSGQSFTQNVYKLNSAGLLTKDGNVYKLKAF